MDGIWDIEIIFQSPADRFKSTFVYRKYIIPKLNDFYRPFIQIMFDLRKYIVW